MNRENRDEHWMKLALELAKGGEGWVEPNPMVGCVVVCDGEMISSGYHERFGGPHAEVQALRGLDAERLSRSTVYVTLEPCAHHGKTPPCVDLFLERPVRRVVVAMEDPFAQVSGRGISMLREARIEVNVGVSRAESRALNAPYLKRLETGLPWVIAKWAMSLDGAIATRTGDSKWISNALSRHQVHRLRSRVDAILVGSSTVLADDPMLTARLGPEEPIARRATRVVLDRRFRIGLESQLVRSARDVPVLVVVDRESTRGQAAKHRAFCEAGVEFLEFEPSLARDSRAGLERMLREIADRGGSNLLVEGGAEVFGGLFDAGLVDQVECYIGPKVIGGKGSLRAVAGMGIGEISEGFGFERVRWESLEGDLHFSGVLAKCPSETLGALE
jgi:diaminohydroxyphosphoribosylaminopyrimidine deaminase/5-amino-6-(5-phosphoribosylamino)uracil reductase